MSQELQQIAIDAGWTPGHLTKFLNNSLPGKKATDRRGTTFVKAIRLAKRMGITLDELAAVVYPETEK